MRLLATLIITGCLCLTGPAFGQSPGVLPLAVPVVHAGSTGAVLAWGRGAFARDLAYSSAYGGAETFLVAGGSGPAATDGERKALTALVSEAEKVGADVPGLLALVHRAHARNRGKAPALAVGAPGDALFNLANRRTACGDVATALSVLLNRAGLRSRIVMLARDPMGVGRSDHVAVEAFVPELGRWVLLEGMLGAGPVPGGLSERPSLGLIDALADPAASRALNAGHGDTYYSGRTGFAMVLPDPDYAHPVEVLWVPTEADAHGFRASRGN